MDKFWTIVRDNGESYQRYGSLMDCILQFQQDGHKLNEIIAIVSH